MFLEKFTIKTTTMHCINSCLDNNTIVTIITHYYINRQVWADFYRVPEVIDITCIMGACDFSDMYALRT